MSNIAQQERHDLIDRSPGQRTARVLNRDGRYEEVNQKFLVWLKSIKMSDYFDQINKMSEDGVFYKIVRAASVCCGPDHLESFVRFHRGSGKKEVMKLLKYEKICGNHLNQIMPYIYNRWSNRYYMHIFYYFYTERYKETKEDSLEDVLDTVHKYYRGAEMENIKLGGAQAWRIFKRHQRQSAPPWAS